MKTKLFSITSFTAVAPGATVSLPHGLNILDGQAVVPDEIKRRTDGLFTVLADEINLIVTNDGDYMADIDILSERWHSIERQLGLMDYSQSNLPIRPWESFAPVGASSGSCTTIGPADSPYQAKPGETIFVDAEGQVVTIVAPPASADRCESFTVKDAGGTAGTNPIIVMPSSPTGFVGDPALNTNCQARSWMSDGNKWIPVTDYSLRAIDQATLVYEGELVQVATSDDELQSLLFRMNEMMDLILLAVEGNN